MQHAPLVGQAELAALDHPVEPLGVGGGREQAGGVEVLDLERCAGCFLHGSTQAGTTDNRGGREPLSTGGSVRFETAPARLLNHGRDGAGGDRATVATTDSSGGRHAP